LLDAMTDLGAEATAIFVNRVIFADDAGDCPRCTLARSWADADARGIAKRFASGRRKIYVIRNRPFEIAGKKALKEFTQELWQLPECSTPKAAAGSVRPWCICTVSRCLRRSLETGFHRRRGIVVFAVDRKRVAGTRLLVSVGFPSASSPTKLA